MATFRAGEREWLLTIDAPRIAEVRQECGIDLGARDCTQFDVLSQDACKTADVLWVLCRKQADGYSMTREAFQGLLVSDTGEQAGNVLFEAIIDFFPSRQRSLLRDMLAKNRAVQEAVQEEASKRLTAPATIEAMKQRAIEQMNAELDKILG